MITSMTGFGQAMNRSASLQIDIRTLNSKSIDIYLQIPKLFYTKEFFIRQELTQKLVRGKITAVVKYQPSEETLYNSNLLEHHYTALKKLAHRVGASSNELFSLALAAATSDNSLEDSLPESTWNTFMLSFNQAIEQCLSFRKTEGATIEKSIFLSIQKIHALLTDIKQLDKTRIETIRDRLHQALAKIQHNVSHDETRLEKELILYIEKIDIHEECSRLHSHLNYFSSVLNEESPNGKKLGFIAQEMGREINTIGAKANNAQVQKYVVEMKEELEKIKEQLYNVL